MLYLKLEPNCTIDELYNGDIRVKLREGLSKEILEFIKNNNHTKIYIANAKGTSYKGLLDVKDKIKKIKICCQHFEWEILSELSNLEELYIDGLFSCKPELANLKKLRHVYSYWCNGYRECFKDLKQISSLSIQGYKEVNLINLGDMNNLEYLGISYSRSPKSLNGIQNFKKLNHLKLENCSGLKDISDIKNLKNLKYLRIDCKSLFEEYNDISSLDTLIELSISGHAKDLKWVSKLSNLKMLTFDCSLENGDINFLLDLPSIELILFNNKKNYSLKLKDVQKVLEEKGHNQEKLRLERVL